MLFKIEIMINQRHEFIGRKNEIFDIENFINSEKAELITIIGKRRIGKTTLTLKSLNDIYLKQENVFIFYFTGQFDVNKNIIKKYLNDKLYSFLKEDSRFSNFLNQNLYNKKAKDIYDFFVNLRTIFYFLKKYYGEQFKFVVYFDEVPWLEGKNITSNGFKNNLALFWNDCFAYEKTVKFFLSGSATQWIEENFINDKGGFHGRITNKINLKPFTLQENYDYLKKNIKENISKKESILYYMAFGGTAYYLSLCQKGLSFEENVKYLFNEGVLVNEYDNLFRSIFNNKVHKDIITFFSENKSIGFTVKDLVKCGFKETETRNALNDLVLSSFIKERKFFNQKGKEKVYYLNDIFSYFYNSFLKKKNKTFSIHDHDFKIWSGFAFELVISNQVDVIKKACGFSDVITEEYSWRNYKSQIDLVIERIDHKIHLVETKFRDKFIYNKEESLNIYNKYNEFQKSFIDSKQNSHIEFILVVFDDIELQHQDDLINRKRKIVKISQEIHD